MKVSGKIVLITGGGKGIGRECAKFLAACGNTVIITGRTEDSLIETAEAISGSGGRASYHVGDVTSVDDCKRIADDVVREFGRIDILINNAGMSMRGLFKDTTLELFNKIMDINFTGSVNMTKCALETITANKGSIVFVSSLSGLKGLPGIAPYGTAKMALTGFSDSLRCELHKTGVHIGIIYVGITQNDPKKKTYKSDGELMDILPRTTKNTQLGVAKAIFSCVKKRRRKVYHSTTGKITKLMYQFFPALSDWLLERFALNQYRRR